MPLDRRVDFLAVDEIQLAADPERGHVFTDRLLHARGDHETMLLGADTIKRLIRRLVPEAEHIVVIASADDECEIGVCLFPQIGGKGGDSGPAARAGGGEQASAALALLVGAVDDLEAFQGMGGRHASPRDSAASPVFS